MTAPYSRVCSTDEDESKGIIVHKTLLQSCSTDEDKSKGIISNKILSQSCSADEGELICTEEYKLECTITEQKYAKNEVIYDVPNYFNVFNIFECGRNILHGLDMSYERAYMATPKEEEFTEMLYHLKIYNECHGQRLSSKKL